MSAANYHVFCKSKPGADGEAVEENFGYEECAYPDTVGQGQLLVENLYLSVDPAQRCQMNEDTGVDYIKPWTIGQTIDGLGGVGRVLQSHSTAYAPNDLICGNFKWPWKKYFVADVDQESGLFSKVPESLLPIVGGKASLMISVFSLVGCTAYCGIVEKGHVTPAANQTLVVSGAAGACGSLAGQIGKLQGCNNVVGICGSEAKCTWLTTDLGFTSAINYKTDDVKEKLKEFCPRGIDVYFDNVGGEISDIVIQQMNENSHVILCGQISQYNKDLPYPPPIPPQTQAAITSKNITRERYLVLNYKDKFPKAIEHLVTWYTQGVLKVGETIEVGLENAGRAFVKMMSGGNTGKQIVKVS